MDKKLNEKLNSNPRKDKDNKEIPETALDIVSDGLPNAKSNLLEPGSNKSKTSVTHNTIAVHGYTKNVTPSMETSSTSSIIFPSSQQNDSELSNAEEQFAKNSSEAHSSYIKVNPSPIAASDKNETKLDPSNLIIRASPDVLSPKNSIKEDQFKNDANVPRDDIYITIDSAFNNNLLFETRDSYPDSTSNTGEVYNPLFSPPVDLKNSVMPTNENHNSNGLNVQTSTESSSESSNEDEEDIEPSIAYRLSFSSIMSSSRPISLISPLGINKIQPPKKHSFQRNSISSQPPYNSKQNRPSHEDNVEKSAKDMIKPTNILHKNHSTESFSVTSVIEFHSIFEKLYVNLKNRVSRVYKKNVSYRNGSLLILILLSPYIVLGAGIYCMDLIVFSAYIEALIYKLALVFCGIIAIESTDIVNRRHSDIVAMDKILVGRAKGSTIAEATKGNFKSKILSFAAFFSYACLLATELGISDKPVSMTAAFGNTMQLKSDFRNITRWPVEDFFYTSIGSSNFCTECTIVYSDPYVLTPVSSFLASISVDYLDEVTAYDHQDILVTKSSCIHYKNISPPASVDKYTVGFIVHDIIEAFGSTILNLDIFSHDVSYYDVRRCVTTIYERSGEVNTKYSVDDTNKVSIKRIVDIMPTNISTCTTIGFHCLNAAERPGLSYALVTALFQNNSTIILPDPSVINLDIFPTQNILLSDVYYEKVLAISLNRMFSTIAGSLAEQKRRILVQSDNLSLRIIIDPTLSQITIIVSAFCVIFSIAMISIDLIKLDKASDKQLKHLSAILKPGLKNLQATAEFCSAPRDDLHNHVNRDWYNTKAKYGECKKSGKIRFGGKEDIHRHIKGKMK